MSNYKLDIAFRNYDRGALLRDGTVKIGGVDATFHSGRIVLASDDKNCGGHSGGNFRRRGQASHVCSVARERLMFLPGANPVRQISPEPAPVRWSTPESRQNALRDTRASVGQKVLAVPHEKLLHNFLA
jgi:hypothetical protein